MLENIALVLTKVHVIIITEDNLKGRQELMPP